MDNTNPTAVDRARSLVPARAARFSVIGYVFDVIGYVFELPLEALLARNAARSGKARIPDAGVRSVHAMLAPPHPDEGFDVLYRVVVRDDGEFDAVRTYGRTHDAIR